MIPESLGKYEIRGTLGRGAMGQVYDGWDKLIHRQVAIKTVRLADAGDEEATEGLARFRREAQAAGRLSHPNIVGVHDFGETDEVAYIVMEYVPGGSLKDLLDRREPLAPAWVLGVMAQVLAGLAYSHARSVVHRDIKPANVLLGADGTAKLADFGIARIEGSSATSVGTIMGTPAYMAPEQFLGEEADSRSDIYAAGAMLFHLLTGTRPYEGNPSAIMHKVLNAAAPPKPSERLAGLPALLDPVLARAMARRKEDRFQEAAAFSSAMTAALSAEEEERTVVMRRPAHETAAPSPAGTRSPTRRGKTRLWLVAAGAALLATGAGAWLVFSPAGRPRPPLPPASRAPDKPPGPAGQAASLNQAIAAIACTVARAGASPGGVAIGGAVGEGAAEASLRQAASGTAPLWQVETVPASYCGALAAAHDAAAGGLISIGLRTARIAKKKQGIVTYLFPSLSGASFPAYLRVDYFSSAGATVYHLYPHQKQADTFEIEDPSIVLAAQGTLMLGGKTHQPVELVPPYQGDLILAVASDRPLLPDPRPDTEAASPYLAALSSAVAEAKSEGRPLAAGARSLTDIDR